MNLGLVNRPVDFLRRSVDSLEADIAQLELKVLMYLGGDKTRRDLCITRLRKEAEQSTEPYITVLRREVDRMHCLRAAGWTEMVYEPIGGSNDPGRRTGTEA